MQIQEWIDLPLLLLVLIIVIIAAGIASKRRGPSVKDPRLKPAAKLLSALDRDKEFEPPETQTRQKIITELYNKKMKEIGLTPSDTAGHVPVSLVGVARFLKDTEMPDDTIEALIQGIYESETEESVTQIVEAAIESVAKTYSDADVSEAKKLALDEWRRNRGVND